MITLQQMAENANDKLVEGFINELVTDSYLLSALTFDDCLDSNGESDLVYAYKRVITPATAQLRALNTENTTYSEPTIKRVTTSPTIINSQFKIDRVTADAAPSLLTLRLQEAKNAIIRKFSDLTINGDKVNDESLEFDGLSKILTDSSTEVQGEVDVSTAAAIKANSFDFAAQMDDLLSLLSGDPGVLLVGRKGANLLAQVGRALGIYQLVETSAGRRISTWDGIPIQKLNDGVIADQDIYAVRFGLDEFHGVTLKTAAIVVNPPKFDEAGAIKAGDAEMVAGVALKTTKSAGVLRTYVPEPDTSGDGSQG
jgi:hypothetical protein